MKRPEIRIRPGFLLGLLVFFGFASGWFVSGEFTNQRDRIRDQKVVAMVEERTMAKLLQENARRVGGVTNLSKEFISQSFSGTNELLEFFGNHTHLTSDLVDVWKTPYRFELVGQTNFIIHSAGRNRKFDDADDIAFDSGSEQFTK